jgi:hypothetical protein
MLQTLKFLSGMAYASAGHRVVNGFKQTVAGIKPDATLAKAKGEIIPYRYQKLDRRRLT